MSELLGTREANGYMFELNDNCYECRGGMYHDEDHDQVPEPNLQLAAAELQTRLKEEGHDTALEWGEKGWIEIYITNKNEEI
jgi:hypothetical protein